MSSGDQVSLGEQLASARTSNILIDATPFDSIGSVGDAYKVQQHAISAYHSPQIGYKVGATNPAVQKLFDCDSPFYGPLFESEHLAADDSLARFTGLIGGEAEFAFRCGSDFPHHDDLDLAELPALLSECQIAVEIVGRRLRGEGLPTLHNAIADFGVSTAFITGDPIEHWQQRDLSAIEVTASIDGEQTNSGTGAAVLGGPLNAVLWLHKALRAHQQNLKTGDWISTGTCLGVIAPQAGARVNVEFSGCGKLSYQID